MSYLDLVALGTVCDVVPLTTLNRAFVMRGMPYLSERNLPGIKALAKIADCADEITPRDCGFGLGPRINAGGRIGDAGLGTALLLARTDEEAEAMAETLNDLNRDRQEMGKDCTEQALDQVRDQFIPGKTRALAVAAVDAHEGIVGISAARLKEALDAPAFVLADTPEGWLKGSGRSVPGFDLGGAIITARKSGLLVKGGGHAMAGGITVEKEKLADFIAFMNAEIDKSEYAVTGVTSRVDAVVPLDRATTGFVDAAQSLAPFGMGNPTPRVMLPGVHMSRVEHLGKARTHIKCFFEDPEMGRSGKVVQGLLWNAVGTPFGDALFANQGAIVDVLGALEINEYKGRRIIQIKIEDVRLTA
jgi:single-stranded-DNA-specific exonuclease